MGYYPWFLAETNNNGFLPPRDIIMYFKKMFELAPAVFYTLLHDNLFNRCRSDCAFLEASYAGAFVIGPSWWNLPGTLSYSNPAEFYEALRSALAGEVDLEANTRMAWEYITDCRLLSHINVERLNLIQGLV